MAINFDHQLNKINTSTSDVDFDITGSIKLPVGTTAQRSTSLTSGHIRFNSSSSNFEGYNGTTWITLGDLGDNTIGSLQDVDTTGITSGQVLKWNGSSFVAADDVDTTLVLANQSIGDLGDVDITSNAPTDGQVLKWDTASSTFIPANDEEDLSNNTTDDLAEGTTNFYYTDTRVDTRIGNTSIGALNDVDITSNAPTDGQVLKWDAATSTFLPANDEEDLSNNTTDDLAEGTTNFYYTDARVDTRIGNTSINALSDIDTVTTAPTDGQVLKWSAAQSKWLPADDLEGSGGPGGGISEGDAIAFAIALGS